MIMKCLKKIQDLNDKIDYHNSIYKTMETQIKKINHELNKGKRGNRIY